MPIRGENIGAAFVRLIIDGDKVPKGVREALDDADDEFDKAGGRQGEIHARALKKSMAKHGLTRDDADKFTARLNARISAGMELMGEKNGRSFFNTFRRSVINELGDGRLADQMIANFERDFARSGFQVDFSNIFGKEGELVANSEATKEWSARIREATKALQEQDAQLDKDVVALRRRIVALRSETDRVSAGQLREFEHLRDAIRNTRTETVGLTGDLRRLQGNLNEGEFAEFSRELEAVNRRLAHPAIITYDRNLNRVGETTGKIFGRGSRSELLNFFGVLAERGTRAFLGLGSAVLKTGAFVGDFINGMREAGEGLGKFATLSAGFTAAGARFAPLIASVFNPATIAAAVAGVVALSLAMGALSSLVIALGGVLTALVATLTGALVGGLAIAAGALAPLIAGIGLTVAAFQSLDDASKQALKDSLEPLTNKFKELGRLAGQNIFGSLEVGAKALVKAFDTEAVTLFVDNVSFAVGEVITMFSEAVASQGFQDFITILGQTMPGQIRALGEAAIQFGAGFGGVLLALQPTVTSMSEGLRDMGRRFNEWANSAGGQTALIEFFEKAQRAARAVGGLIWDIGEALIELFNGEAGTIGIEIFEKMREKVQQFTDYLRDPKNKEEIDDFFRDAKEIGGQLWRIAENILGAFRKFGGDENREDLKRLLGWIENITEAVEALAGVLSKISVTGTLKGLASILPGVGPAIGLGGILNADGARNYQNGWAIVGEEGPELIKVPGGSNIYSNPESRAMSGGNVVNLNINNYGPQTSADIRQQIDYNLRYGATFGPTSALAG